MLTNLKPVTTTLYGGYNFMVVLKENYSEKVFAV